MAGEFRYDVFISYSSRDKAVVRELATRLKRDGVRVWFDEWELRIGDHIPAKIEEGLEHSHVLILCMSANAFGSDWLELESQTFRFRDPLNRERRFIPLKLDDYPLKGSLAQFLYLDWRVADDAKYSHLLDLCRSSDSSHARVTPGETQTIAKTARTAPMGPNQPLLVMHARSVKGFLSILEQRGLLKSALGLLSARTRNVIEHLGPATWIEGRIFEELMDVIGCLGGREMVAIISLEVARTQMGPFPMAFIRAMLEVVSPRPESVFKHLNRLVALQVKGLNLTYIPETQSSGRMEIVYPHLPSDFLCASWDGLLHLVFEACNVQGTIDRGELDKEHRRLRIKMRWEPKR